MGAVAASSLTTKFPAVVVKCASYVLVLSMVTAGALAYFFVLTVALVEAGHPAATALVLAWAWVTAGAVVVVVGTVVVVELAEGVVGGGGVVVALGFPPAKISAPEPRTSSAITPTMTPRRMFLRRFS